MSKAAMKQKRSSGIHQNNDQIEDVLRHVGSKQNLFLETHICTINRITLLATESFSESKALTLVEKYHRKRQSHCNAALLEDRLSLERSKSSGKIPFRPWVSYKEIMHLYISHSRPEYFIMCIDSHRSYQKYYEIYKCKTSDNVRKVEEYIRRAMNDPEKRLRNAQAIRQVSVQPDERVRSLANFEMQNSRETIMLNESPKEEPFHYRTPSPVLAPIISKPVQQVHVSAAPKESPPIQFKRCNIDDLEDVTYITIDPHKGATVSKNGPIYMYLSRQENHINSLYNDNQYEVSKNANKAYSYINNINDDDNFYNKSYSLERSSYQVGY